jgi:hypothetical protein
MICSDYVCQRIIDKLEDISNVALVKLKKERSNKQRFSNIKDSCVYLQGFRLSNACDMG